ncbi:DUF397 domain-containing protein [Streptomyces orinoci]|uniref:DUF397 domain-containing protein n=1 Tax=Streptomyces orinoci TaxID=67339 RepID=A0ABV3K0E5_STRON|nr:DUF397 domain-containing protein [Streptomyces orinoci]
MNKTSWFKSSYSGQNGSNCVEVAWFKSSYSRENGDACLEIAPLPERVAIRDSKNPALRAITAPVPAWKAFVADLRNE